MLPSTTCFSVRPGLKGHLLLRSKLHEQMADVLTGLLGHTVRHDQPVAVLWLAFQAEQADGLRCREPDRLAKIEQGLGLAHMLKEDALEACHISGLSGVASSLWGAEPAQMAIGDADLGEMRGELMLGEGLLARETGAARMSSTSSIPASRRVRMKAAMLVPA